MALGGGVDMTAIVRELEALPPLRAGLPLQWLEAEPWRGAAGANFAMNPISRSESAAAHGLPPSWPESGAARSDAAAAAAAVESAVAGSAATAISKSELAATRLAATSAPEPAAAACESGAAEAKLVEAAAEHGERAASGADATTSAAAAQVWQLWRSSYALMRLQL